MPLAGYTALLTSFAIMSVPTRVRSAAQASASKSNISFACCSKSSGTPAGLRGHVEVVADLAARRARCAARPRARPRDGARAARGRRRAACASSAAASVEHRVEQARGLRAPLRALLGRRAVAEQPLEHDLRIHLHRQRRRRRAPRDRIAVGAREARAAAQAAFLERQLERRQRRVLAEGLRRDLIDRRAEPRRRARLGPRAREPDGRRARVVGAGRGVLAVGERQRQVADDVEPIAERLERAQDRRQLEARARPSPASTGA